MIFTEKGKNGMSENEHQDAGDKCKDSSEKKRPAKAFLTPFLISRAIILCSKSRAGLTEGIQYIKSYDFGIPCRSASRHDCHVNYQHEKEIEINIRNSTDNKGKKRRPCISHASEN